jgi:hypothetical protein
MLIHIGSLAADKILDFVLILPVTARRSSVGLFLVCGRQDLGRSQKALAQFSGVIKTREYFDDN